MRGFFLGLAILSLATVVAAQDVHVVPRVPVKSTAPLASASLLEFRGFRPGMSFAEAHARYLDRVKPSVAGEWRRIGIQVQSDKVQDWTCNYHPAQTFACTYIVESLKFEMYYTFVATFMDDRLVSAYWSTPRYGYLTTRDGLVEKYGPAAASENGTWQNRMGARVVGENQTWKSVGSVLLQLHEFGDRMDSFSVSIVDLNLVSEYSKRSGGKPDI